MKLFVITALVAVAAAGRLEHLERSYLPPGNSVSVARSAFSSNGGFGSPSSHGGVGSPSFHGGVGAPISHGGVGSPISHGSFGANSGAFGAAGAGLPRNSAGAPFAGATSNQYLPPNHGPSASNGASQFAGSLQGLGGPSFRSLQNSGHQASPAQQYAGPSMQYRTPQTSRSFGPSSFQPQYPQQSAATSRQYLAPEARSFKNSPQQAFDEETGYHY